MILLPLLFEPMRPPPLHDAQGGLAPPGKIFDARPTPSLTHFICPILPERSLCRAMKGPQSVAARRSRCLTLRGKGITRPEGFAFGGVSLRDTV
jgi:hypothetical protein